MFHYTAFTMKKTRSLGSSLTGCIAPRGSLCRPLFMWITHLYFLQEITPKVLTGYSETPCIQYTTTAIPRIIKLFGLTVFVVLTH